MRRLLVCAAIIVWSGLLHSPVHAAKGPTVGSEMGYVYAQGKAPRSGGTTSAPDMSYHGGTILSTAYISAIFWGPSWSDTTFSNDKIIGIDAFYTGFDRSSYAATSDEYSGSNGQISSSTTYGGHSIDTSTAANGSKPSAILAEVARQITNPVANGFYAVYTDLPRGNAKYCAWHSWGLVSGVEVQFAYFFSLDGDSGCDPQSTVPFQSQGLAALANVSAAELSEARTDPRGDGWYDSAGLENGGKCAWTFGGPYVTLSNGTQWKLQGEWSNYAYDNGTGYQNASGQGGCIDGSNYPGPFTM